MNRKFFGDSYDLVKRFFIQQLSELDYAVHADLLLTGDWGENEVAFRKLVGLGASPSGPESRNYRKALFLDPDTGVRETRGRRHVSYERLAGEVETYDLVLAFDQSFARGSDSDALIRHKLKELGRRNCFGMYYDSHARFLFVSQSHGILEECRTRTYFKTCRSVSIAHARWKNAA